MKFGSLFSGIGGMDKGLEDAGMYCAWQVEIDEYCQRVLTKHWRDVPKFRDIRECGRDNLEPVDLIAGGFPCQDVSVAGKQAGLIEGNRSGLWFEFHRIICELRPRYALIENVPGLLVRGLERVLCDLTSIGYDAEWNTLSAAAFGAPHLRERIFIVAYHRQERIQRFFTEEIQRVSAFSWCEDVRRIENLRGRPDIPEPLFRGGRDGIPNWMDRIAGIGNAVVPQVAEYIGRRIIEVDESLYPLRDCDAPEGEEGDL